MKRIPTWLIILMVVALIVGSKFLFFSNDKKAAAAKKPASAPVTASYFVVKPDTFTNAIYSTGQVGAFNSVDLVPEVSGKVVRIYFKEGSAVQKGDVLVKLNDADLQAQLLKTRTQLKLSQQKLSRLEKLLTVKGISQEEFDMQENELASLKADEAFTQAQIAKTTITAPFSGLLGLKNISEGALVNATTPIVSVVQTSPVFIEFSVPEKYSSSLKKDLRISFSIGSSDNAATYTASVYAIEPTVDQATKTIKARASYSGSSALYPGTFVKVNVNMGITRNALMIPTQAVVPTLKGQKVIVSRAAVANEVPVEIGIRTARRIQVTNGLKVGDTIVTTGLLSIRQDSKLRLIREVK